MAMALLSRDTTSRSLPALSAAGEENNRCADEKENHGCKTSPHADAVVCVRAAAVFVDVVLDDLENTALVEFEYPRFRYEDLLRTQRNR